MAVIVVFYVKRGAHVRGELRHKAKYAVVMTKADVEIVTFKVKPERFVIVFFDFAFGYFPIPFYADDKSFLSFVIKVVEQIFRFVAVERNDFVARFYSEFVTDAVFVNVCNLQHS